jgi:LytR_cpsA_psr family/LytR cell envelope-related transcriptional attenuator
VLGGVQVCLKHPVPLDTYSGFHAKRAGYQHLNAKMALAFVRQRHGLTNGDLDRTHRQQAFLDSVMHQLRTEGVLSDLTKINSLLSVAKQYVITDSGWNLLDFATQMRSLTSGNLSFNTLPIESYITIEGQSANQVNVPYIQQLVHQTFYPAPRPASSGPQPSGTASVSPAVAAKTTVDVLNGGSTPGLAGQVSAALVKDGYKAGQVGNTAALTATQVLYGTGSAASAGKIASLFGVTATSSANVAAGHVQVMLGSNATVPGATPTSSSSAVTLPTTGAQGGAVTAKNGIPCVD